MEQVVALWNECLPKDPISVDRFWRTILLDPNFRAEGAVVAEIEGRTVGFLLAIARRAPIGISKFDPHFGWISVFFVAPEFRRMKVGRRMVKTGIDFLHWHGSLTVTVNGYAPYYAFPGVDLEYRGALRFMEAVGFQPLIEVVAMGLSLEEIEVPETIMTSRDHFKASGVIVRPFDLLDTVPLLQFAEEHFDYWHQSLIDGLQQNCANVLVACRGEEILGFAQWENPQTDPPSGAPGRFGPFGVRPDLRGNGLGAVIFYTLIEKVKAEGANNLWFGWAGGKNFTFYERAGCSVTRRYQMFRMQLDQGAVSHS